MPVPVIYLLFSASFLTLRQFRQHSYMLNDEISNSSPDPQISAGQGTSYSACVPLRTLIFLYFHTATFSQENNHNFCVCVCVREVILYFHFTYYLLASGTYKNLDSHQEISVLSFLLAKAVSLFFWFCPPCICLMMPVSCFLISRCLWPVTTQSQSPSYVSEGISENVQLSFLEFSEKT